MMGYWGLAVQERRFLILCLVWIFLLLPAGMQSQEIFLNEILASNVSVNSDPDYASFSDWVEIYNAGDQPIEFDGYTLTDDFDEPGKWPLPEGTILPAKSYLLIWADGRSHGTRALHASFKLDSDGEFLGLFDALGLVVDSLSFPAQTANISFGRSPDGADQWVQLKNPTPNAANLSDPFLQTDPPQFSIPGGFFSHPQTVSLESHDPAAVIRYTLDCSDPSETSPIYQSPLVLKSRRGEANFFSEIRTTADPEPWLPDWTPPAGEVFKATVVRARSFLAGQEPSKIVTHTYFIDENIMSRYSGIAVVSLVSDYNNLFDDTVGIYVPGNTHRKGESSSGNYFQDWERPAHIEFFESDCRSAFSQDIGIKIQGGSSPASPQKGLHVIARSEYGRNRIEYPVFAETRFAARDVKVFKRFIIRAWGSTINAALFNDAYAQALVADTDLDLNAYRPAVLFINGEYWGLHELREANKNSWYYQFHYGINRENPGFDLLEHRKRDGNPVVTVDEGDALHWNGMLEFLQTHDMSTPENYEHIKTLLDVDNFIEYIGHCVYLANWDWPNNNEGSWRPRTADGRWRKILYDMETSFGVAETLNPIYATLGSSFDMIHNVLYGTHIIGFGQYGPQPVLGKLLENEEFKHKFARWFYDNMKSRYKPERMAALLDEMAAEIEPFLPEYRQRWPFETQMNNDWRYHLDLIKEFAQERPVYMRQHLINEFGAEAFVQMENGGEQFQLAGNWPNPFNRSTFIEYQLSRSEQVLLTIFDLSGREVIELVHARQRSGLHRVQWRADNVASGFYFARIQAGEYSAVHKMVLAR